MKTGFIYALYYNNKPFYIGQAVDIERRYEDHHRCATNHIKYNNKLYTYIRTLPNKFADVSLKIIKEVEINKLTKWEKKCIKYCIDRNTTIYNYCHYTRKLLDNKYTI